MRFDRRVACKFMAGSLLGDPPAFRVITQFPADRFAGFPPMGATRAC